VNAFTGEMERMCSELQFVNSVQVSSVDVLRTFVNMSVTKQDARPACKKSHASDLDGCYAVVEASTAVRPR